MTNLSPGAKLDLVPAKNRDAPITIVLRAQEADNGPIQESTGTFTASSTIWEIMRKLEAKGSLTNSATTTNITERAAPSGTSGSGRLHYVMPVARVMNREVSGFRELQQTLSDFGIRSGRQLVTLRYKETNIPFEVALEEIARFSPPEEKAAEAGMPGGGESSKGAGGEKKEADKDLMFDTPEETAKQDDTGGNNAMEVDELVEGSIDALENEGGPSEPSDSNKPMVSVSRPPQSNTLAAAQSKDYWSPF